MNQTGGGWKIVSRCGQSSLEFRSECIFDGILVYFYIGYKIQFRNCCSAFFFISFFLFALNSRFFNWVWRRERENKEFFHMNFRMVYFFRKSIQYSISINKTIFTIICLVNDKLFSRKFRKFIDAKQNGSKWQKVEMCTCLESITIFMESINSMKTVQFHARCGRHGYDMIELIVVPGDVCVL